MKELTTAIEIDSPPEQVWQALTDFPRYPEWNPFLKQIEGELKQGTVLDVRIGSMRFRPTLLEVEPPRKLRWLGKLIAGGLFDGEHRFEITPLSADWVRFEQSERFTGLLVPLLWLLMGASTKRGLEAMNAALKQRAEGAAPG